MDHILLHTHDERPLSTMVGIDPTRFFLEIPETPAELVQFFIEVSRDCPVRFLEKLTASGRACGCGVIYPGAIVMRSVPGYLRPSGVLEIHHNRKSNTVHVAGQDPHIAYRLKPCEARMQFGENNTERRQHPLQDHFADDRESWGLQEQIMSFSFGIWDEIGHRNPNLFKRSVLSSVGVFTALARLFDDEDRSYQNYVGVTSDRIGRMRHLLHREAALIGNQPIDPNHLVPGPRLRDFEAMTSPHAQFRDAGRAIGRHLHNASEDEVLLASYLAYDETPGLMVPGDGVYRDLNIDGITSHERIAATALKSDFLRSFTTSEAA